MGEIRVESESAEILSIESPDRAIDLFERRMLQELVFNDYIAL